MKRQVPFLFALLLTHASVRASTEGVITATKKSYENGETEAQLVVKVNHLVVYGLTANRGNCQIYLANVSKRIECAE
jgi:hypothetical protein